MDVQDVKINDLKSHPNNPRLGNVEAIAKSIQENGWWGTVVAQKSTNHVLAGNHRVMAAKSLNIQTVPVYWVDVDDEQAVKILLADNRTNDIATYDSAILNQLLADLSISDNLLGTGYVDEDLELLLLDTVDVALLASDNEQVARTLEGLPEVTLDVPNFIPEAGSEWKLGVHTLFVCNDIMKDWPQWIHLLDGDVMFVPYPGPFIPLVAPDSPVLIMIQPNKEVAAHLLKNWNSVKPTAVQVQ